MALRTWGIARFCESGPMQYLLVSGKWLSDGQLFNGAPILLFESKKEAEEHAAQLGMRGQADGVQFMVDQQGKVLTAH